MPSPSRITRRALSAVALVSAVGSTVYMAGCASDSTAPGAPGASGALALALTDAPFPFESVARADLFVVRIDGKIEDADSAEAESGKDDAAKPDGDPHKGWVTLAEPNQSFNLLDLQGGKTANLAQKALPTGTYRGFRLILDTDKSSVTLKNGSVLTGANGMIKFPSAGRSGIKIRLDQPISVVTGGSQMVVDFDLGKSFVLRGKSIGKSGLLFKPVIRGTASEQTGGISGMVHATTATGAVVGSASVDVLKDGTPVTDTVSANVVATTKTDSTGAYTVRFLQPATYSVRVTPPSTSTSGPGLVPSVVVASGKTTTGTDVILP